MALLVEPSILRGPSAETGEGMRWTVEELASASGLVHDVDIVDGDDISLS